MNERSEKQHIPSVTSYITNCFVNNLWYHLSNDHHSGLSYGVIAGIMSILRPVRPRWFRQAQLWPLWWFSLRYQTNCCVAEEDTTNVLNMLDGKYGKESVEVRLAQLTPSTAVVSFKDKRTRKKLIDNLIKTRTGSVYLHLTNDKISYVTFSLQAKEWPNGHKSEPRFRMSTFKYNSTKTADYYYNTF